MGNLRGWEWVILLVLVLLLFGARRLPDLARSVGRSMKIFKSEVKDVRTDDTPQTPDDGARPDDGATSTSDASTPPGDGEPREP